MNEWISFFIHLMIPLRGWSSAEQLHLKARSPCVQWDVQNTKDECYGLEHHIGKEKKKAILKDVCFFCKYFLANKKCINNTYILLIHILFSVCFSCQVRMQSTLYSIHINTNVTLCSMLPCMTLE